MVFVYTCLYRSASSSSKSARPTIALAPADLILCFRLHRDNAYIFSRRARQPLGIISGFLSRHARRSHTEHFHTVAAWSGNRMGCLRFDLSDRFTSAVDIRATLCSDGRSMVCRLRRSAGHRIWDFHRPNVELARRQADRPTALPRMRSRMESSTFILLLHAPMNLGSCWVRWTT